MAFHIILGQTIQVPIDHRDPQLGTFELEYGFGADFNPDLPTVVVISDAQQFYVRKGRIKKIQEELFSDSTNVAGIIPRSTNLDLRKKIELHSNESTNWSLAYNIYRSYQFAHDIHSIVNHIPGDIYLYGQSGGAFLITEYLSLFPNSRVKKVFIGASVNPVIENKLGIIHDDFQRAYLSENPLARKRLDTILKDGFFDRSLVAGLFQRQNFFVELSELDNERSKLMERLYQRDTSYIANLKQEFQIEAINNLFDSEDGIPIRVRLSEFINPLIDHCNIEQGLFYPDIENSCHIAQPLLDYFKDRNQDISSTFNENTFRNFRGQVFILSGRFDHVADYRTSIYLGGLLNNATLFMADDDHTFKSLKSEGHYSKMIQDFFFQTSQNWIQKYSSFQWKEK